MSDIKFIRPSIFQHFFFVFRHSVFDFRYSVFDFRYFILTRHLQNFRGRFPKIFFESCAEVIRA